MDVKNSISDTVNLNGFQSQKADKIMHGWGIKNIKQIVDENHGEMQCACKDGMFDVNMKPCELCLDGHYIHCFQTKCLKNSRAKSLLGTLDGYMWKYKFIHK